jgi:ubiquinone/menaquinone biosynthesis C-methylase UbiE
MTQPGQAWKNERTVRAYLEGIRGAIPLAAEQIDVMLRMISRSRGPHERFLDLGCGGGPLTLALLDRFPQAHVMLVDYSDPMLAEARERLAPFGEQCSMVTADLGLASWVSEAGANGPFDAIVSGFAIHHLTDERKRALYEEIFALLREGAFFINVEHVSSPSAWLTEAFDDTLIDSFYAYQQSLGSGKSRDDVASEYVHRPDKEENILASVEEQCGWLREIGYQDVDCYFKLFELAVFGGRKPE